MMKNRRKDFGELMNNQVKMDTQTIYHANGDVNIFPCSYETAQAPVVAGANQLSHRGRMTVHESGRGVFRAYREGGDPRYHTLFSTESGELYASQKHLYVRIKLPLGMSACRQTETLFKQIGDICDYLKKNL